MSAGEPAAVAPQRPLSTLDCIGIGINGIIGSGIFMLPAAVFRHAGGRSPLAWLLVGGLCFLVGLCFAEAASYTDRSGGPYAYARMAFGRELGYAVGFVALSSMMLSYATVARGLTENLWAFVPSVRGNEVAVGAVTIGVLAAINAVGLKPGAWTSNGFSAAKLVPLLALAGLGLLAVRWGALDAPPAPRVGEEAGIVPAAMAGLFACSGFEFIGVPAGETRNPSRAVPIALLGSLGGSIVLYAILQIVAVGTTPELAEARPALVVVAGHAVGPQFARLVALGAVVSAFGFCASSALIGPSYLAAFASDDMLPPLIARRTARGAPLLAILVYSAAAALLGLAGDFQRLADIANIAVVVQYVSTCVAVLVLRRTRPRARFHLPLGPIIPLVAIAGCALFLRAVGRAETRVCAGVIATGFALRLVHLGWRKMAA